MRNLKKILALVLALVMSLSLMAAAGASSFPDVDDGNPYATAIEVLDELKVFQGFDDGTFKPTETLNRAQAAVLVYRIATGDVENKYLDNYTFMQQSKFTDLDGYNWAKGYINYCQNAGIVVGTTATTFDPGAKVTGYQLLVMLLRTLGYGKAGEFADPKGWELQTAAIAEREGILKNVTTGDLGAPAPRQMVAEILFRGLLTETVTYSALTSGGYTKGETLGMRELGLEEIEGVVMANEFADLNTPQVLPEGKTQVQVEGEEKVRTLDYGTKITDIGESRLIYTQNTARVLSIADSGKNTTKEYGEGVDISTAAKFRSVSELTETTETEYYTNFEPTGYYTSDWRIEYTIWKDMTASEAAAYLANNSGKYLGDPINSHPHNGVTYFWYNYNKAIKAGDPITLEDMNNIYTIFTQSNGIWGDEVDQLLPDDVIGQVFVGTQTKKDISDEISYNQFFDTYINDIVTDKNWNTSNNGEWVKFIDNDGDGDAEYAFRTQYALTEVVSSYANKAGDTVMQYAWDNTRNTGTDVRRQNFDDDDHTNQNWDYTVRYMQDDEAIERDVAVGDIVLAAWIDNQYLVSKAESVTTEATNYNYKDDEITAADGNTYGQSGIGNVTTMQNLLASMAPKTTYEMFLDKFGFVRAYRLPGGTQYALVTEVYYKNNAQGNLIQNWPMTVELTMPDEDGKPVTKEYNLANLNSALRSDYFAWTQISNLAQSGNYYNWLQPAVAHLGVTWRDMTPVIDDTPTLGSSANLSYWTKSLQLIRPIASLGTSGEFNYGPQNYIGRGTANYGNPVPVDDTVSFTNVAVVSIDGDDATVNGAAKVRLNQVGQASGVRTANDYAVDYIQLSTGSVVKGAASYNVGGDDAYRASYNRIVNADKDTEIYIVYDKGVKYFKGYANMPALNADTVGSIHAAYTVARNTNTGTSSNNYWIADVIVYEVEKWDDLSETSISLAYYTYNQSVQSASSVTIDTLNNKTDPAKVQLVPSGMSWGSNNNWWDSWGYRNGYGWLTDNGTGNVVTGYGFYRLYNETSATEGVMSAAAIEKITKDFNKAGIFAGTVTREVDLAKNGYIPVNMTGAFQDGRLKTEALVSIADGKVYSVTYQGKTNETSDYYPYYEANNLWFNNSVYSNVKANDRIIWVGSGVKGTTVNSASFIVDLGSRTNGLNDLVDNSALWDQTASWLRDEISTGSARNGLWKQIMLDQNPTPDHSGDIKITIEYRKNVTTSADGSVITGEEPTEIYVEKNGKWNIALADLAKDGYVLAGLYTHNNAGNNTTLTALGGYYGINNVGTADITLYANYTPATYTLKVVGATTQTSTATFDYIQPNGDVATHSSFTLDNAGSGAADNVQKDSKFTITVTVANNKTISVVGNSAVEDLKVSAMDAATRKVTITGKVTGAAEVTVTEAARVLEVKQISGTGVTPLSNVSVSINSAAATTPTLPATVTVAANDTYEITITPAAFTTYEYSTDGVNYADVPANGKITGTIAADDWTTTVTIKASKMTNEAIDAAVIAPGGVPSGAATVGADQIGYNDAYAMLGVDVQSGNPKSTITVDRVNFMTKAMDSSASTAVKNAINTIWSTADPSLCAAGVSLLMPAGTAKVRVTTNTGGISNYNLNDPGSNLVTSSNGNGNIYLNLWLTLATGTHANHGDPITNFQLGNQAGVTNRTIVYTIEIFANSADNDPVATIERVVEVIYS